MCVSQYSHLVSELLSLHPAFCFPLCIFSLRFFVSVVCSGISSCTSLSESLLTGAAASLYSMSVTLLISSSNLNPSAILFDHPLV